MNRKVLVAGLALVVPLVVVLLIGLGRDPHTVRSPLIGRTAPSFSLRPVGGGPPFSLETLKGRAVVLNFWATWCVPCAEEHEVLARGARTWGREVQFLGVVYEDQEDAVQEYLQKHEAAYPSLFDDGGRTAIAFGVYGVPETFFIAPTGTIVEKFVGPLATSELRANIVKALAVSAEASQQVGSTR
jgi:cytochrome c biogenesis protein CcmG, thiol:disulfide interchange protein DsbE